MFTHFNRIEREIHFPDDRRLFIKLKPAVLLWFGCILLLIVGLAWMQYVLFGLPATPIYSANESSSVAEKGFPVWLIFCHWINFFFLTILIRSGLSILFDHPRLYFNEGCKPGSEWLKFTPVQVGSKGLWTAKDDARYISPLISLPGYRHTVGIARGWHFIHVPFFVINGAVYVALLFIGGHWMRIVPTTWQIIPDAWNVFVHYATFNLPVEPNGFYQYNALQQLAYFGVIFILAPLAILSGLSMSPAIENRFHWLPKLFGNRQGARSVHFLVMVAYTIFIFIHVALVIVTGVVRNLNHITLGTDNATSMTGVFIALAIILFTTGFLVYAHWLSWNRARHIQKIEAVINGNLWHATINKLKPKSFYSKEDISDFFGRMESSLFPKRGSNWQKKILKTTN